MKMKEISFSKQWI